MNNLNEKYKGKVIIRRVDDELLRYEIKCYEGYRLKGKCFLGKYADELFEETVNSKDYLCYNLREVRSLLKILVEGD